MKLYNVLLVILTGFSVGAATFTADFNSGSVPPGSSLTGNAMVIVGGIGANGDVLQLTEDLPGFLGGMLIDDFSSGVPISFFDATFKVELGPAAGADGFSFNWGTNLAGNATEEGEGTGLTIAFDTYDNGGGEAPAIDIKWLGTTIAHSVIPFDFSAAWSAFVPVRVTLTNGTVTVLWNGVTVHSGVALAGFSSFTGAKFSLGARTGDTSERHLIDDLAITIDAAPTASNLSTPETYIEDTPLNLVDIVVSDADNTATTVTMRLSNPSAGTLTTGTSGPVTSTYNAGTGVWTAAGAIANVNTLLAGVSFVPAANFNGNFSITNTVSDGIAAISGIKAMTGTPVNDPPTASNLSTPETSPEDVTLNLTDIVVSDVDNTTTTVTLQLSNPSAGGLTSGTSGPVTSTYNAGTGVWTATGPIANVNTLLAGVSFVPATNFNGNFTITNTVSDGIAAISGTKSVTITPVNDPPNASNLSAPETYTENTPLNLVDIVVSDVDNSTTTVTLQLSNPAAGSLTTGTSGPVTSVYAPGTGVWSASGAIANVNTLLAGVSFIPATNFSSSFTIATSVSDGGATINGAKAVTPAPVRPLLTIVRLPPGQATISWSPNTAGFVLQETLSLSPANWTNSISGAANPVIISTTNNEKFFRVSNE